MAKKKYKSQSSSNPSEEATTSTPSPATSASTSKPKEKKEKMPQPSTSALIICRNKYVLRFILRIPWNPIVGTHQIQFSHIVLKYFPPQASIAQISLCSRRPTCLQSLTSFTNATTGTGDISLLSTDLGYNYLRKYSRVWRTTIIISLGHVQLTLPFSSTSLRSDSWLMMLRIWLCEQQAVSHRRPLRTP